MKQFEVDFTFLARQSMMATVVAGSPEEAIEKLTGAVSEQLSDFQIHGVSELPPELHIPVPPLPEAEEELEGNAPTTNTIN